MEVHRGDDTHRIDPAAIWDHRVGKIAGVATDGAKATLFERQNGGLGMFRVSASDLTCGPPQNTPPPSLSRA